MLYQLRTGPDLGHAGRIPTTSMGPRLILHETLSNAATCGEGVGEHSSCLAAHSNTETRVQARK